MNDDFPIDDELAGRILGAITGGGNTAGWVISAVDIIAPLVIRNGEPALLAVARLLSDKIIGDLGLRPGDTVNVKDADGNVVSMATAPHQTARHQVLAYEFVTARLAGDEQRQREICRWPEIFADGGSGLCGGLVEAVRKHHDARARTQP